MKYLEYQKNGIDIATLPLHILRGVDVDSPEEENLVQEVIHSKLSVLPPEQVVYINDIVKKMDEDTNMTPEKEAEYQKQIDERVNAVKNEPIKTEIKTVESELAVITEEIKAEKRFCEFCLSKGVRHLKICTRQKINGTN